MARDDSTPLEVRLEELITGEQADIFWLPVARSDEQLRVQAALSTALVAYERAFGTENTIQQLDLLRVTTRAIARKNAAQRRILDARAQINADAAAAREAGNEDLAVEIESRPTPRYPQLDADLRELCNDV